MSRSIQVNGLRKSYGSHIVLKGLDFQIEKGELFSLLGVNGAGKTTSLECIEGLKKYDSGTIMVNGKLGDPLALFAFGGHVFPLKLYDFIAQTVESVHEMQAAFPVESIADMVKRIVIETLDKIVGVIFHLQIDDDICVLLEIDCLHLQHFCF